MPLQKSRKPIWSLSWPVKNAMCSRYAGYLCLHFSGLAHACVSVCSFAGAKETGKSACAGLLPNNSRIQGITAQRFDAVSENLYLPCRQVFEHRLLVVAHKNIVRRSEYTGWDQVRDRLHVLHVQHQQNPLTIAHFVIKHRLRNADAPCLV